MLWPLIFSPWALWTADMPRRKGGRCPHPPGIRVELLKHPNWITLLVLLVALAVIVLVVFLAYRIATRGRRTRYCGKRRGSGYRPYRG